MKKTFLIFCVVLQAFAVNAKVISHRFQNIYVLNAAFTLFGAEEALRQLQVYTNRGASIVFDTDKKEVRLKTFAPEKNDLFHIEKITQNDDGDTEYECVGDDNQGQVTITDSVKNGGFICIAMLEHGLVFFITNKAANEL